MMMKFYFQMEDLSTDTGLSPEGIRNITVAFRVHVIVARSKAMQMFWLVT